jgi:hypothetical protein
MMRANENAATAHPLSYAVYSKNNGQRTTDDGQARRGLSLTEVLISFFILLIGVVSVIALFPVGVLSVKQAVIDTRSTITALEAQSLVLGMQFPDDPYLLRPPHQGFQLMGIPFNSPNPPAFGQSPSGGDPRGVDPATTPSLAGTRPSSDIYTGGGATIVAPNVNNVYATIMNANGQAPPFPANSTALVGQRFHPLAGAGIGFPVFVDPHLANSTAFQFDSGTPMNTPAYKRIAISADQMLGGTPFLSMAPFINNLNDLVIHSLSEVQYQPFGPAGGPIAAVSQRDQFIRQHFYGQDEIHTEGTLVTAPYNPNRFQGTPLPGWRYVRSADSASPTTPGTLQPPGHGVTSATANQSYNTGSRNDAYSWSFVVRNRNLQAQPANGPPQPSGAATPAGLDCPDPPVPPGGTRHPYLVPKPQDYTNDNITVLVFNKRSIGRGYHLVRGCLFNGSATLTLCWDPAVVTDAPSIRRGTWIMEATLSPGLRDNTPGTAAGGPAPLPATSLLAASAPPAAPASGYVKYRHAVEFYRVASVQEAVLNQTDGQVYQVVNLEQTVTNYPISHVLGDGRALPDLYEAETFSGLAAYPNYLPAQAVTTTGNRAVNTVWVPIVVLHGLQEVFTVRN